MAKHGLKGGIKISHILGLQREKNGEGQKKEKKRKMKKKKRKKREEPKGMDFYDFWYGFYMESKDLMVLYGILGNFMSSKPRV